PRRVCKTFTGQQRPHVYQISSTKDDNVYGPLRRLIKLKIQGTTMLRKYRLLQTLATNKTEGDLFYESVKSLWFLYFGIGIYVPNA
ncbi:MAG: hypothetical protein MJK18_07125, partial [Bdellovibrionales bacterium]|nr:hypothetical protein [Bdellovibrionales bacterium]